MAFSRPRGDAATRHLFVGNAGPAVGQTEEDLRAIFGAFGDVQAILPIQGRSHVFVSFGSEEEASAAMEVLAGAEGAAPGRSLVIKYAEAKRDQEKVHLPVCFSAQQTGIPGLELLLDFITSQEEEELLMAVDSCESWEELARRRVLHFGYEFKYVTRNIDLSAPLGPLPPFLQPVMGRLHGLPAMEQDELDQVTVNEYPPGVGLSAHIDTHSAFTGPILSLSLAAAVVMEFRRGEERRLILLPRRSLLVMADESRYAWAHYIPHRKTDTINGQVVLRQGRRVSFTFRKARGFRCDCRFPEFCDSQGSCLPPTRMAQKLGLSDSIAPGADPDEGPDTQGTAGTSEETPFSPEVQLRALEEAHVHQVYEAIAPHFSSTRVAIWPKVREFIESLPPGALLIDAGCGNGKYFGVRRDVAVIGSDRSTGLVQQAHRRISPTPEQHLTVRGADPGHSACSPAADVYLADSMALSLRDNACDGLVSVAVLHHVSSPERRVRMLSELLRVVRPGGRVLVTVWAQEQENPKKLAKWLPMSTLPGNGHQGTDAGPGSEGCDGLLLGTGGDYYVPWHLPFHRAEAAAVLKSIDSAKRSDGASGGQIDHEKGTVMFKRYYHLFRQGELTRLGEQVPGCIVQDEFFDASNWCMVLRKDDL